MIGWIGLAFLAVATALIVYSARQKGTPGRGDGGTIEGCLGIVLGAVGAGFLFVQAMI